MFGFRKDQPAPEGPVGFEAELDFAVPATKLYALLDFSSSDCWKRGVGEVTEVEPGSFTMALELLPNVVFEIEVLETVPNEIYAYSCVANPQVGKLLRAVEGYQINPTGRDSCHVSLVVMADFESGMTKAEWQEEVDMMTIGVNNSLAKMKIHAECGIEAVEAVERAQSGAVDEAA